MLRVGLTGGIGSGKSTVAAALAARGALVLDADAIAREVVEPGGPAYGPVVTRFGTGIVGPDGRIDRPALASVVFGDPSARADLEAIVHPAIGAVMEARLVDAPDDAVVVFDVPLLVEHRVERGEFNRPYDLVVVVETARDVRLARLEGRGVSRADAEARMAVQATDEQRRAVVDEHGGFVIDNSGDVAALEAAVDDVWRALRQRVGFPTR